MSKRFKESFQELKLKDARIEKKLSQEKISRIINVSLKHYQNIEYGITTPTVTIALHICEVLDIDPREVDEWKDRRIPN
ncbi:helix-turn-helix transcriptional regulator [Brevibacillus brevis]|uniref:helix-turn-helix transcriptional regulator n=1 Tax=Brevibacillus brevis TaxID=1393 RepID=UPI0009EF0EED|nr:helix-turn-helix transcriptional regulator [Brevibacillus brevis]